MKPAEIQRSLLTRHGHHCQSGIVHRHGLVCLFAIFCFLLPDHLPVSAADLGSSQDGRAVICGPPRDLAELAVGKSCLKEGVALAKARVKRLTFTVNLSRCFIYPAPEGFEYLGVADLEPFTEPAEPQLPMKTFPVVMDKEAEIYGVEVVSGTYREVQQPVYIVPIPWLGFTDDGKYLPNEALYRTNTFFPGSLVAYDQGNDSKRQHVFVRFFPLQYVPGQRKALLVTQATLKLYYGERDRGSEAKVKKTFTRKKSAEGGLHPARAECVIVCPAALQKEAQRLSDFHTRVEGIRSSVVTTETIETAYAPAEDPPFQGYTNPQLDGWDSITNYRYRLAKQIIAYLQDQEMHPGLAYVTILGDGLLVPPSYYYYFGKSPQIHYSWTPTDFLYASPDYDFVPNCAVGRLSVNDAAEAAHVVDKIIRWHRNVRWEWFQNVWLAGGRSYDYMPYNAEMVHNEAIKEGLFSRMRVKKCYQSAGRFERAYVLPALTTAPVGILDYGCHGAVGRIQLNSTTIAAQDLLDAPANDRIPIVLGKSCNSGAYDLDLMKTPFSCSFGEAVLKSPAGGVAYFGGSRLTSGWPLYYFQRGEPRITKLTEMAGMTHYALRSYHQGSDTLGQLYSDALYSFVANNKMTGHRINTQSVFPFILLGDPALKIPKQR